MLEPQHLVSLDAKEESLKICKHILSAAKLYPLDLFGNWERLICCGEATRSWFAVPSSHSFAPRIVLLRYPPTKE